LSRCRYVHEYNTLTRNYVSGDHSLIEGVGLGSIIPAWAAGMLGSLFLNPSLGAAAPARLALRLQDRLGVLAHPCGAVFTSIGPYRFGVLGSPFEPIIALVYTDALGSLGVRQGRSRTPALPGRGRRVSHRAASTMRSLRGCGDVCHQTIL
jgi:hypothetical protein